MSVDKYFEYLKDENGEPLLDKNGKPKKKFHSWRWRIQVRKHPRKYETKMCFATEKEALKDEKRRMKELGLDENEEARQVMTLKRGLGLFLSEKIRLESAKSTIEGYTISKDKHILPYFDNTDYGLNKKHITELQYEDILEWTTWAFEEGKTKGVLNDCLKFMKAAGNFLVKIRKINFNPFLAFEKFKMDDIEYNVLNVRQVTRFLRRAKKRFGKKMYLIFKIAIYAGLREGEIFGLDIKNIDLSDLHNAKLHIRQQYTGGELKEKLKSKSSRRSVDIDSELASEIKEYVVENNITEGLLFTTLEGNPMNKNNIRGRNFKPLLEELKFNINTRFHDLRHTYASIMLSHGANIIYISQQMGHSSTSITLNIYTHFVNDVWKLNQVKFKEYLALHNNIITLRFIDNVIAMHEWLKKKKEPLKDNIFIRKKHLRLVSSK